MRPTDLDPWPKVTLATAMQTEGALTFEYELEQSLDGGEPPCDLWTWAFGREGNLRLQA